MSFGFSINDIVTISTLAWNISKACRKAPESFGEVQQDLLSLASILDETNEVTQGRNLSADRQERLSTVLSGCNAVLGDLQGLVQKYESLGTQTRRTWDRMKWYAVDIEGMRSRLTLQMTMLSVFISTSQVRVGEKLSQLLKEVKLGQRAGSAVSTPAIECLRTDDDQACWDQISKDLQDVGITAAAFTANRDFILQWFTNAMRSGDLSEQTPTSEQPKPQLNGRPPIEYDSSCYSNDAFSTLPASPVEAGGYEFAPTNFELGRRSTWTSTASTLYDETYQGPLAAPPSDVPRRASTSSKRSKILPFSMSSSKSRLREEVSNAINDCNPAQLRLVLEAAAQRGSLQRADLAESLITACGPIPNMDKKMRIPIVESLLQYGADVNLRNKGDLTALIMAVDNGLHAIVAILMKSGANSSATAGSRSKHATRSALHVAALQNDAVAVEVLCRAGASTNPLDRENNSPLHYAAHHAQDLALSKLLEYGAAVNGFNHHGETPLHIAAKGNRPAPGLALLKAGAIPDAKYSPRSPTALKILVSRNEYSEGLLVSGKADFIRHFVEHGASLDFRESDGRTLLHKSVFRRRYDDIEFLLDCGADPTVVDLRHKTPLQYAHVLGGNEAKAYYPGIRDPQEVAEIQATLDVLMRRTPRPVASEYSDAYIG